MMLKYKALLKALILIGCIACLKLLLLDSLQPSMPSAEYQQSDSKHSLDYKVFGSSDKTVIHIHHKTVKSPLVYEYVANMSRTKEATEQMMAVGENECGHWLGLDLLDRWRSSKKPYCSSTKTGTKEQPRVGEALPQSQMSCHLIKEHHSENICDVYNVAFDVDILANQQIEANWNGAEPPAGAIKLSDCQLDEDLFRQDNFGNAAQKFLFQGLQKQVTNEPVVCDAIVDHDLLMLSRWDPTNLFHFHEDVIHTFSAFGVTDLDVENTEVMLLDSRMPLDGPFHLFWERVFTGKRHRSNKLAETADKDDYKQPLTRDIHSLAKELQQSGKKTLCVARAVFGVHGGISPFSRGIGESLHSCKQGTTALIHGYRDFIWARLGFNDDKAMVPSVFDEDLLRVVVVSRRGVRRELRTETDLVRKLIAARCEAWSNTKLADGFSPTGTGCKVTVKLIDLKDMSLFSQMQMIRETDLLIGAHGCGLTHALYMPKWGAVIELQHPSRMGNYHFQRISTMVGLEWTSFSLPGETGDEESAVSQAASAANAMADRIISRRREFSKLVR